MPDANWQAAKCLCLLSLAHNSHHPHLEQADHSTVDATLLLIRMRVSDSLSCLTEERLQSYKVNPL